MAYWLFKTEPDTFSIDTLRTQKVSCWEGVRNYQARNMMRDQVKVGDFVLIYHSSCKNVGVAGIAKVVREAIPTIFSLTQKVIITTQNRTQITLVGLWSILSLCVKPRG